MTKSSTMNASAQMDEAMKAAKSNFDKFSKATKEQMEKTWPNAMQGYEESATQMKQNMDAMAQCLAMFTKGFEQVATAVTGFTQETMENNISVAKTMMGCKDMKEMMEMQADVTRSNMDRFMSEGSKIAEMSMKVANEASQPLQKRMNQAAEQMAKKAAA